MTGIILEGPDGSGKSTLLTQLSSVTDQPVWHPGGAVEDKLVKTWMKQCEHKLRQDFILDRTTHVSEFIYGPVINGRDIVSFREVKNFFRLCNENGWKIIYCRPTSIKMLNHIKAEHDSDEQIAAVEANHLTLVKAYDSLFCSSISDDLNEQNNLFIYDYEQTGSFSKLLTFLGRK